MRKAILMATHDVGKAEEISSRAIWIEEGRVRADGATHDVLERYLEPRVTVAALDPPGTSAGVSRLAAVALLDTRGQPATCYFPGDPIRVAIELELTRRVELPYFLVSIAGAFGPIAAASMFHDGWRPPFIDGRYRIECTFRNLILAPRQRFTVRFAVYARTYYDCLSKQSCELVTAVSAERCGSLTHSRKTILEATSVAEYSWRMPAAREAWTSEAMGRNAPRKRLSRGPEQSLSDALRWLLPTAHGPGRRSAELLAQFTALMATGRTVPQPDSGLVSHRVVRRAPTPRRRLPSAHPLHGGEPSVSCFV